MKNSTRKRSIKLRITEVKLKTGETEILISNLPFDKSNKEDLKQIYGKRWKIETNYDRLKNRVKIENFTGHRKTIIQQDFYSNILLFNFLIATKLSTEAKKEEKTGKKLKLELQSKFKCIIWFNQSRNIGTVHRKHHIKTKSSKKNNEYPHKKI
ncbi:MAG: transposase [Methanobacteriaceae archaeon]|nr:transposase [Methanobacteriaceae archaeon]